MNPGIAARPAIWATMRAIAAEVGVVRLASALMRSAMDAIRALAPYVPSRLSRMISSLCSRLVPPSASATSARPSSCRQPVTASVTAIAIAAAGHGGSCPARASP